MPPTHPAAEQLQKCKRLQSGVYKLWLHYSHEAAKLKKWSSEPGGEDLLSEAKTAQTLATRFKSALEQLNFELDELLEANFNQWKDKAAELNSKFDAAIKEVEDHCKQLETMATTAKKGAQVLGAILDVLKFLALIP